MAVRINERKRPRPGSAAEKKRRKKLLRQVLGIFGRIAAPAHIGIEWVPVDAAEFFQGGVGARGIRPTSGQYDRPMGRGEDGTLRRVTMNRSRIARSGMACRVSAMRRRD